MRLIPDHVQADCIYEEWSVHAGCSIHDSFIALPELKAQLILCVMNTSTTLPAYQGPFWRSRESLRAQLARKVGAVCPHALMYCHF